MTGFVSTTVAAVAAAHPGAQAGLLQFSNDVRVELPPRPLEPSAFHAHLATMVQHHHPRTTTPPRQVL